MIDGLLSSAHRDLYEPDQFIAGKDGSAHNFGRGHYTIGSQYIGACKDKIRKLAEKCSNLHGFMVFNSVGGGTGSGLTTRILETLSIDYTKADKTSFTVFPCPPVYDYTTEPYNSVLATNSIIHHTDKTVVFNNWAL